QRIPAGRFGEHQELANLAVFLVAEGVEFITGEVVTIDGGEALAGAGQFSQFIQQDRQQLKRLLAMMRGK
ncbi:SDR family oxidoreductase, partial [candidate division KSB1 bacterium]|nr:SDR family oxidoreductase [candidate division KSB1 bacterium]